MWRKRETMKPEDQLKLGLRPCVVYDGRTGRHTALFHRWVDAEYEPETRVLGRHSMEDNSILTYALVEICETGAVWYCMPKDMFFIDSDLFLKYRYEEIEKRKEFYKKVGGNGE